MFEFIEDETVREAAIKAHQEQVDALKTSVQSQVDEAVKGLKSKNDELLAEKKKIQEKLTEFAELDDPKLAKEALDFFNKSTDAQLIRDGRIEELIQNKTKQYRQDMDTKLAELDKSIKEKETLATTYKSKFEIKMVEDHLREVALNAGVMPAALGDILMRGRSVFSLSSNNEVEARDSEGKLVKTKDDMILTSDKWINSLKESNPYYWPPSKSGGFMGTGANDNDDLQTRLNDLASRGDMVGYKALREKMKKAGTKK